MNTISNCCHRPILTGTKMEYPLGGSTWGIPYEVEYCESCGLEAEPIEVTECCGEEICTCIEDELEALRIAGARS